MGLFLDSRRMWASVVQLFGRRTRVACAAQEALLSAAMVMAPAARCSPQS